MDINDSVGIMDSHFPYAEFFTEFEAFVEDQKMKGNKLDYISICSPNYLHSPHMKYALKNGIDVICEKPLVLNSKVLDILAEYEKIIVHGILNQQQYLDVASKCDVGLGSFALFRKMYKKAQP